jgi:hypothetical protein
MKTLVAVLAVLVVACGGGQVSGGSTVSASTAHVFYAQVGPVTDAGVVHVEFDEPMSSYAVSIYVTNGCAPILQTGTRTSTGFDLAFVDHLTGQDVPVTCSLNSVDVIVAGKLAVQP